MTKKLKKYALLLLILATCPACAGPKITQQDVEIARYQSETARACYLAQENIARQWSDAKDAALMLMAQALARPGDPCKQDNVYSARAAIAASQSNAAANALRSVVTGTIATAGIVAGADVLKTAFNAAGNSTNITTTGNGNSASYTAYDTRSAATTRQYVSGDQSGANAAQPTTAPDQRETTTITNEAE